MFLSETDDVCKGMKCKIFLFVFFYPFKRPFMTAICYSLPEKIPIGPGFKRHTGKQYNATDVGILYNPKKYTIHENYPDECNALHIRHASIFPG